MTIFKKNVLATLIILAGLGTAVGAYAQNTSDTSSRGTMFESIDTNNDNALSLEPNANIFHSPILSIISYLYTYSTFLLDLLSSPYPNISYILDLSKSNHVSNFYLLYS